MSEKRRWPVWSDNIRRLRREHNETQEELGRAVGLSSMAISQWENGRAVPRMGALEALSTHWGIPKSRILEGTEYDTEKGSWKRLSDRERNLLFMFRSLNDRGQKRILDYTEDLLSSGNYERSQGGTAQVYAS